MDRRRRIVAAATEVLAAAGARGLTHRAVDNQAQLPAGSTSNVFRTRAALIGAIVEELLADDEARLTALGPLPSSAAAAGRYLARFVAQTLERRRTETIARYALYADPDAAALVAGRAGLAELLAEQARARGLTADPAALALALAFVDGVLADAVLFQAPVNEASLADGFSRLLQVSSR